MWMFLEPIRFLLGLPLIESVEARVAKSQAIKHLEKQARELRGKAMEAEAQAQLEWDAGRNAIDRHRQIIAGQK